MVYNNFGILEKVFHQFFFIEMFDDSVQLVLSYLKIKPHKKYIILKNKISYNNLN